MLINMALVLGRKDDAPGIDTIRWRNVHLGCETYITGMMREARDGERADGGEESDSYRSAAEPAGSFEGGDS